MKKLMTPIACAMAIVSVVACSNGSSTTSTDSTANYGGSATERASASAGKTVKTSYVDLNSGASVEVTKDTASGYYINTQTRQPLEYYVDPATADTFDRSGRLVNNAIVKGPDGKYMVDESKIKNSDGDTKTDAQTAGDEDVKSPSGKSKEKIKDDEYKMKDANGKVKIKDDKTKVKIN